MDKAAREPSQSANAARSQGEALVRAGSPVIYDITLALKSDPCLRFTHSVAVECPWTDVDETARSMVTKATDFLRCRPSDLYLKVASGPTCGAMWSPPTPTSSELSERRTDAGQTSGRNT